MCIRDSFYGGQTLRQLLPPAIESATPQPGPWPLPAGMIRDTPRFVWRGLMLDVARHFFSMADVKRVIDPVSYTHLDVYKRQVYWAVTMLQSALMLAVPSAAKVMACLLYTSRCV